MEIKLLKKCVDSFCPADFVPVWSMFKSHDDWSNRLHALWKEINFERWTVKLLVTLEMQKKNTVAPTEKHNQFYWLTGQLNGKSPLTSLDIIESSQLFSDVRVPLLAVSILVTLSRICKSLQAHKILLSSLTSAESAKLNESSNHEYKPIIENIRRYSNAYLTDHPWYFNKTLPQLIQFKESQTIRPSRTHNFVVCSFQIILFIIAFIEG